MSQNLIEAAKKWAEKGFRGNKTKQGFAANIPGCCDPEHPFRPIPPNDCRTCRKNADYTCWNLFPEGPSKKVGKNE